MARIPLPETLMAGAFTLDDGRAAGLGTKRLNGKDLRRPFRGIRSTDDSTDIESIARAFNRGAHPHAFFCGITAAVLLRIPLPPAYENLRLLHVAVPSQRRAPKERGTIGHTFQIDSVDVRDWNGLRITTPERTWCDLATVLSIPDLVAAGDYLIHWENPLATIVTIEAARQRHRGRRGRSKLVRAIDMLNDRSESRQESLLRVTMVRGGIRGIRANLPIRTSGGYNYRADIALPDRKFIVEYQSRFHDGSTEFRSDMTRTSRLEADGWCVMQVNMEDLDNPRELVQRIRTVLRSRPVIPVIP
ncbi:MAG: DUF559 domain-containing protein [Terrimesophilobacter sp.]